MTKCLSRMPREGLKSTIFVGEDVAGPSLGITDGGHTFATGLRHSSFHSGASRGQPDDGGAVAAGGEHVGAVGGERDRRDFLRVAFER